MRTKIIKLSSFITLLKRKSLVTLDQYPPEEKVLPGELGRLGKTKLIIKELKEDIKRRNNVTGRE